MRRSLLFGTVFAAAMAVGVGAQSGSTQDRDSHQGDRGDKVTVTGCLQSADNWSGSSSSMGSTAGTTSGTTSGSTAGSTSGSMTGGSSQYGSGSTSANAAGARFVLTNVSMGAKENESSSYPTTASSGSSTTASGSSTTSGQTGATGTTGSNSAMNGSFNNNALWLVASSSDNNWSKYLNHRVEVKGTLDNSGSSSGYTSGSSTGTGSTTTSGSTTTGSTSGGSMTGSTASQSNPSSYGTQNQGSMGMLHVTSIKEISGTCSASQR